MNNPHSIDYLIVGQGLAGSALAIALIERGASVWVVDASHLSSATEVAAGLITPLSGKGMNPSWRQKDCYSKALEYFSRLEQESKKQLFYPHKIVRPFTNRQEFLRFHKNKQKRADWLSWNATLQAGIKADFGHFTMRGGGRVDTSAYLAAVRSLLSDQLIDAEVSERDFTFERNRVQWRSQWFKKVIFCTGFRGLERGLFSFLPSRSAKGEILTLRIDDLEQDEIISRNGWLVPIGASLWRAGASYSWDELDAIPTAEGRADVEHRVSKLIACSYEITDHQAGVRPIVNNSQPVIGLHPQFDSVGIFNGLGSKGVLSSRYAALHFADFLMDGVALDPELDYRRTLK